jgi:MFS family permease
MVIFALGNFLGPLLLGRLFDTVGRKPMIAGTYFGSALMTLVLALLLLTDTLTSTTFIALLAVTFFIASAGASAAYLTVSEIFPLEMRALAIALFYATGTAVGGITGPFIFGRLIDSGDKSLVAIGFFIGAAAMAVGGLAEIVWGVKAEQQSLESIATPISAEEAQALAAAEAPVSPQAEQHERVRQDRIRQRAERRRQLATAGARRYRPGVGTDFYSPGMVGTAGPTRRFAAVSADELDREIETLARILEQRGPLRRAELAALAGARWWGPVRFRRALAAAVEEGRAERLSRDAYGPPSG